MPGYATTLDLREMLGRSEATATDRGYTSVAAENADLAVVLDEASAYVDQWTRHGQFGPKLTTVRAEGSPEVIAPGETRARRIDRTFYGDGLSLLRIDPAYGTQTSPIEVYLGDRDDGVVVASSGYRELTARASASVYGLRLLDERVWIADCRYSVYAFYGTPTTPDAVKRTVLELAAIRLGTGGGSSAPFESGAGTVEAAPPIVGDVVDKYIREYRLTPR